jgi:hypothetical protein
MILMDLNEQVDWDFSRALRKARLRRLVLRLRGRSAACGTSPSFEEVQGKRQAYNRVRRGRRVVDLEKIVGSVGRSRDFDNSFMPLRAAAGERWKRVDLAFYRDQALPPVSLYKLGDDYFVEDGNHRISVARYHSLPDVEADVTELRPISTRPVGRLSARSGFAFACQHAA